MKKSTVLKLCLMTGMFASAAAYGQMFNLHECGQQGFPFYTGYNVTAFGQGAASDPGNNVWNGFGNGQPGTGWCFGAPHTNDVLLPNNPGNPYAWNNQTTPKSFASGPDLFSPYGSSQGVWDKNAGNANSAAAHSPITVPRMVYASDNGSAFEPSNDGARTNVAPFIFSGAAIVTAGSPGVGTSDNPMGLITLSNVPPGTYNLFLYGANFDGTRGASFIVSSGTPSNGVFATMNPNAAGGSGPLTNFVFGTNYVVYNNVSPAVDSTITVTWGAVSNINSGQFGEGDFNGLQLGAGAPVLAGPTFIQQPRDTTFSQGVTATLASQARGNPAVAYQWYSGSPPGTPVAGQTAASLSFANAQAAQSGQYFVVATNTSGPAATSSVVNLTIAAAPIIVAQSSTNALILYSGQNRFTTSLSTFGAAPITYYWQASGVTVATTVNSPSNTFNNIVASATYTCIVSNSFGHVTSQPLPVTVIAAPTSPFATALLALNPYAYWPLTETTGGTAYDYIAGNNGAIQGGTAVGSPGPGTGFGSPSYSYNLPNATGAYVDVPGAGVDLQSSMSLVTWTAGGTAGASRFQTVAGKGDSSYRTDIDTGGIAHFSNVGSAGDAQGGPVIWDASAWHQIVGTYDAVAKRQFVYVDGVLVGNVAMTAATPGNGRDFWIGGAPDYAINRLFAGSIAQVALFNYTLSSNQVQNLFLAGRTPPFISVEPTNFSGNVNGTAKFFVGASGPGPLAYQWSGPGGVIAGATSALLTLNNLNQSGTPPNGGPGDYSCTVTNLYGSTNSGPGTLAVVSSSPVFNLDLPAFSYGIVGNPVVFSVDVAGNEPFTNQWYYNGSALHFGDRGGRVGPVTNLTLVIDNAQTNDNGSYQVDVTNGIAPFFALSQVTQLTVEKEPLFNGDGSGWIANNGPSVSSDVLQLTTAANGQYRSFWFNVPMYIAAFKTTFNYQATGSGTLADGITFCVQNDPRGVTALGGGGGSLGYGGNNGIINSAAVCVDLFNARGYQFVTGGVSPDGTGNYTDTRPTVDTGSGNPIRVVILYSGNNLDLTLTDTVTLGSVHTNLVVGSIPVIVGGNKAIIGFTGATGGLNANQTVSSFTFVPLPTLSIARNGSGGVVLSWPNGIGGYQLESNSSLNNPAGWSIIPGPYSSVGSNFQRTVSPATGTQFYRLVLTP
jgi:hypothetical protein